MTLPQTIDMLLFCPVCHRQHIDKVEIYDCSAPTCGCDTGQCMAQQNTWENPPHKSHLCKGCGVIWRPADVETNGVATINTRGVSDNWPVQDDGIPF